MNNDLLAKVTEVLTNARTAKVTPARASGCGRVYVVLGSTFNKATLKYEKIDPKVVKIVEKAAAATGMIFQRKAHYGMTNALYVGYDNATGTELARGTALAESLKALGISAYMDAHGD